MSSVNDKGLFAYYGTSGTGERDGIYIQEAKGVPLQLSESYLESPERKAGFLCFNKSNSVLYATVLGPNGEGWIKAYRRDAGSGQLETLGQVETAGGGLCHLNLDRAESWLLAVSYGDARVSVFAVNSDGSIGAQSDTLALEGTGTLVVPDRQEAPHAHSIYTDPSNRFVFVCDLGMDRIYVYRFGAGTLTPSPQPYVATEGGAGPRHLAFHGNGNWVYAINELNGSITQYSWDGEAGTLTPQGSVDTLPSDFAELNTTAEILVHPSGRFLYGSNRGHDSIAVYAIDPESGALELTQRVSSGGQHPRNFTLDSKGSLLVAANRDSDNIVYFKVDPTSGSLDPIETVDGIPACTCVRLVDQ